MLNFAMDNFIECMESSDCEISSLRNSNEGFTVHLLHNLYLLKETNCIHIF